MHVTESCLFRRKMAFCNCRSRLNAVAPRYISFCTCRKSQPTHFTRVDLLDQPHVQDQADEQGNTSLMRIIMSSADPQHRNESARTLLLQYKDSDNSHLGDKLQDPLQMAVRLGDLDMCCLLLRVGKVNSLSALTRQHDGRFVLKDQTPENEKNRLAILDLLSGNASTAEE